MEVWWLGGGVVADGGVLAAGGVVAELVAHLPLSHPVSGSNLGQGAS